MSRFSQWWERMPEWDRLLIDSVIFMISVLLLAYLARSAVK
jgi:hypothetical protein